MAEPIAVDARGQKCPMPVVLLARAVKGAPAGSEAVVFSDDPAAAHDIPAWCRMRNAELLAVGEPDHTGTAEYRIRLAGAS